MQASTMSHFLPHVNSKSSDRTMQMMFTPWQIYVHVTVSINFLIHLFLDAYYTLSCKFFCPSHASISISDPSVDYSFLD